MDEEPKRMWIDISPPVSPEAGDVWFRFGEARMWSGSAWDPPWLPPQVTMPPGYPKAGPRKGRHRKKIKPEPSSSQAPV